MAEASVHDRGDGGFTLAELLIVIVILGILASVTVFAVRGITNKGEESACGVELDQLVKAQEIHLVRTGSYANEADLVAAGTITKASTRYDAAGDASGFSVSAAAGSSCTGSTAATGPAVPVTPPAAMTGTPVTFHGVSAYRYTAGGSGNNEILVLGRAGAQADWIAASNDGATTTRRTHFLSLDGLTAASLGTVINNAQNNGVTDIAIYLGDDTSNLPGTSGSVYDFVLPIANSDSNTNLRTLSGGGFNLQAIFGITG